MQQIHEFLQEVLLIGGVVARSAGTSRTTRTTGATRTPGTIRASGFVWTAWLGVVIFITMVVLVCSVSRGIGFASGIVRFCDGRLPPIGCGSRCWGVWGSDLPGIHQIYWSFSVVEVHQVEKYHRGWIVMQ